MENENLTTGENIENKGTDTAVVNPDGTNVAPNGGTNEGINANSVESTIPNAEVVPNDDVSEKITEINIDDNINNVNSNEGVSTETNVNM